MACDSSSFTEGLAVSCDCHREDLRLSPNGDVDREIVEFENRIGRI